ncbi:MAG: HIT domain-containing protein [Candidatus Omnitrophota bacterium]
MTTLWAPWRINYVGKTLKQKGCLLCKFAKEKRPNKKNLVFLTSKLSFSVLNKFPYNNGHVMICPRRHIKNLSQLAKNEILDLIELLIKTQKLLDTSLSAQGYNIGINIGRVAGAGIENHLHIHLVPRWKGDTNFMPIIAKTKVISQSLEELFKKLKKLSKNAQENK